MSKRNPHAGTVASLGRDAPPNLKYLPTVKWRETQLPAWATQRDHFAFSKVCGDSLQDAGINHGDFVLILLTSDIEEGDLVAVSTPRGYLVKYISYLPGNRVRLQGANGNERPRIFPLRSIRIEGRIVRTDSI